ncbi:energy-coupling factor transporter transmembrane protein EcfT [Tepidibacillus infernus]|uniref:energy-coupling factor transporter transmembrane component T family protein n=1 Tax=Tepidibacillus infernus TaxID=1806172 RepID=UPI003B758D9C
MSLSQYMIIGQFIPNHSFLHRLDPRSKLIFTFLFIILVFLAKDLTSYFVLILTILSGVILSRIPFSYYFKGLLPIFWMIILTIILHLSMTKGGNLLFQWYWLTIYEEGVKQAIYISIRLLLLVLTATILTLTTSPIDLTMGLERLMYPFTFLKVPVHELALMMSISLRFIPTLLDETDKIIKAQTARGANFESGPIHKRVRNMVAIIIPLFISAFKRADELAIAMEARGYRGGKGRTRLRVSVFTWRDLLLMFIFLLLFILMITV